MAARKSRKVQPKAEVINFPKTKGKKAPVAVKTPVKRAAKAPFQELGRSKFPILRGNDDKDGVVGVDGLTFMGTRATSWLRWRKDADGQAFVPKIVVAARADDDAVTLAASPYVAGAMCAALAVALAEGEIQVPKNLGFAGTRKEWQEVVRLMRQLKMIDADMEPDLIEIP